MERFYKILAYVFGGLGTYFLFAGMSQGRLDPILLLFIFVFFILPCAFFTKKSHQLQRKDKTINFTDVRPPFVLYLRSFLDDKTTGKTAYFLTDENNEEESLVSVLGQIAPVYAIGDPKDEKMPMGASRIYVDDEHWKNTVRDLAQKAEAVVLRLGKTDSFWWEVEMALDEVPLHKLLFAIPVAESFSEVSTLYKIFLNKNIDISDQNIGVKKVKMGSLSSFLYFDADGKPHTNTIESPRVKIAKTYEEVLQKSLADFFTVFSSNNSNLNLSASTLDFKSENITTDDAYNRLSSDGDTNNDDKELIARLAQQAREQIKEQQINNPDLTDKLIKKALEMKDGISMAKEKLSESDAYNKAKDGLIDASKSVADKASEIKHKIEHSDAYHQTKDKAKNIGSLIADGLIKLGKEIKKRM